MTTKWCFFCVLKEAVFVFGLFVLFCCLIWNPTFFFFQLHAFTSIFVIGKLTFKQLLPQILLGLCLCERKSFNKIRDISSGTEPYEDEVQPGLLKMVMENYYYFTLRQLSMLCSVYMYCIITQYSFDQKFLFSV